jgi:hypothetical protein
VAHHKAIDLLDSKVGQTIGVEEVKKGTHRVLLATQDDSTIDVMYSHKDGTTNGRTIIHGEVHHVGPSATTVHELEVLGGTLVVQMHVTVIEVGPVAIRVIVTFGALTSTYSDVTKINLRVALTRVTIGVRLVLVAEVKMTIEQILIEIIVVARIVETEKLFGAKGLSDRRAVTRKVKNRTMDGQLCVRSSFLVS